MFLHKGIKTYARFNSIPLSKLHVVLIETMTPVRNIDFYDCASSFHPHFILQLQQHTMNEQSSDSFPPAMLIRRHFDKRHDALQLRTNVL